MNTYRKKRYPALSSADFRMYLIGQFVSAMGSQMQIVALNWHIYTLTHSAVALGFIGLFRFIPVVIFSLLGGAVADSYDRKKVQIYSCVGLAVFAALLGIFTWTGSVSASSIYILTILAAAVSAFDMPARQSFVPSLVKKEDIPNALSLNIIMWQTATIAGPAVSGFMIAYAGISSIYAFNAFSYIFLMVTLFYIKTHGKVENAQSAISVRAVFDSFRFVRSKSILWSTMLVDFFSTFFASATSLIPIFAKDILHSGPEGVGLLYAATSVGAVGAGFFMAHVGTIKKPGFVLLGGVAIYALATMMFGVSQFFAVSFIALMLIGAGDSISTVIRHTIRQLETPDNLRGRMSAINMIFVLGGPQLGEFEAGLLAAAVGAPMSVVLGGISTLLVVSAVAYYIPKLRNYDWSHEHQPALT